MKWRIDSARKINNILGAAAPRLEPPQPEPPVQWPPPQPAAPQSTPVTEAATGRWMLPLPGLAVAVWLLTGLCLAGYLHCAYMLRPRKGG